MRLNSKQIAEFTGATVIVEALDPSQLALGITWDSRDVQEDFVYVALPGERVDGHDFIDEALRKGAHIILCMQGVPESTRILAHEMGAAILEVSSTFSAITDLARGWRGFIKGTVVALTGSTGKTTTNESLARCSCEYLQKWWRPKATRIMSLACPKRFWTRILKPISWSLRWECADRGSCESCAIS